MGRGGAADGVIAAGRCTAVWLSTKPTSNEPILVPRGYWAPAMLWMAALLTFGAEVWLFGLPDSDGYPEAWFTRNWEQTGPYQRSTYPNHHPTATDGTHPVWIPEFFGDVACVHRIAFPYLDVEPRKYRFRVLNGSNARFYHLALKDEFMRPQWGKGLVTPPAGKITDAPQGRCGARCRTRPVNRRLLLSLPAAARCRSRDARLCRRARLPGRTA
jgi:hypothetical protein